MSLQCAQPVMIRMIILCAVYLMGIGFAMATAAAEPPPRPSAQRDGMVVAPHHITTTGSASLVPTGDDGAARIFAAGTPGPALLALLMAGLVMGSGYLGLLLGRSRPELAGPHGFAFLVGATRGPPEIGPAPLALPAPPAAPLQGNAQAMEDVQRLRAIRLLPLPVYEACIDELGRLHILAASQAIGELAMCPVDEFLDQIAWAGRIDWGSCTAASPLLESMAEAVAGQATPQGATLDYRLRRGDGSWLWVRESARVLGREENGSLRILGALTDATREHEFAQAADANARVAAGGLMAANLAHELKQPLAVIALAADNALEALADGETGIADATIRLHRISHHAERARTVATQMRAFAKQESVSLEACGLNAVINSALALMEPRLAGAGVRLEKSVPPGPGPVVLGQPVLLEQVLINLLENALDAMAEVDGERRLSINVGQAREEGCIALRVTDTGGGIPDGIMGRLFTPFFTTKPEGKGTGLGLPLSRTTMRRCGGDVRLSNVSGGTVATIILRLHTPGGAQELLPPPQARDE